MQSYEFYRDRAEVTVGIATSEDYQELATALGDDYFHKWKINGVALYWAISHLVSAIHALTRAAGGLNARLTELEEIVGGRYGSTNQRDTVQTSRSNNRCRCHNQKPT